MKINTLEKININNSEHWILVRGRNADAPLFIHVQAGPGLPIIPEASAMEKLLHLENNFLVVYWDQRGCGKSFNNNINPATVNISQLTDDLIECTKYLLNKYNKDKAILSGYSIWCSSLSVGCQKRQQYVQQFIFNRYGYRHPCG